MSDIAHNDYQTKSEADLEDLAQSKDCSYPGHSEFYVQNKSQPEEISICDGVNSGDKTQPLEVNDYQCGDQDESIGASYVKVEEDSDDLDKTMELANDAELVTSQQNTDESLNDSLELDKTVPKIIETEEEPVNTFPSNESGGQIVELTDLRTDNNESFHEVSSPSLQEENRKKCDQDSNHDLIEAEVCMEQATVKNEESLGMEQTESFEQLESVNKESVSIITEDEIKSCDEVQEGFMASEITKEPSSVTPKLIGNIVMESLSEDSNELVQETTTGASETALAASEVEYETTQAVPNEEHKTKDVPEKDPEAEWLDVLGNGLIMKKVVTKGLGPETRPQRGQEVTIQYEATTAQESIYENDQLFTFIVADGDASEALDLSVCLMEKSESCLVVSDVKYCFNKSHERPAKLPKEGNVTYKIELKSIVEGPYNTSVDIDRRLKWADDKKKEGNSLYGKKRFDYSLGAYRKSIEVLKQALNQEDVEENKKTQIKEMVVKCYNNVAASHLQLGSWRLANKACTDAENYDSRNVKTLLRKAKALNQLGMCEDAISVLKRALRIDPNAKDAQTDLTKYTKKLNDQKEKQKKMCERMFGGPPAKKAEESKETILSSWKSPLILGSSAIVIAAALLGFFTYQKQ